MPEKTPEQLTGKDALKTRIKGLLRQWHPDIIGTTTGKNYAVIHILAELNTNLNDDSISDFTEGWPENIPDGAMVDFPSGESIYVPPTPEVFLNSLKEYKDGTFRAENYPRVTLQRTQNRDGERRAKLDLDPTLDKFLKFITESESTENLLRAFDLFSLYSEDQLREINVPAAIDQRAAFLLERDAWQASNKDDVNSVIDRVKEFPFFSESSRLHTVDNIQTRLAEFTTDQESTEPAEHVTDRRDIERNARQSFLAKIRMAETTEELQNLDAEVQSYNFFNRAELGVVRSVMLRKMRKIGAIDK